MIFIKRFYLLCISVATLASCDSNKTDDRIVDVKALTAFYGSPTAEKDSVKVAAREKNELQIDSFAGPDLIPSPACLATSATGEVYVGVDRIGSLGKDPEKGSIIKLVDTNNDGKADTHTLFAQVDNPRGIMAVGDALYVLHTTFSKETKEATGMDLVKFEDKNNDGVADGPSQPLIKISAIPRP